LVDVDELMNSGKRQGALNLIPCATITLDQ
jgi:hypothetical protein